MRAVHHDARARHRILCAPRLLLALLLIAGGGSARLEAQSGNRLSRMQQEAREYLRLVQVQMETLSERLAAEKPDDADRLRGARERIVRDLLLEDMRAISQLLDDEEYVPALGTIEKVRGNLEAVITLLQDRGRDPEEVRRELDRTREKREAIGRMADTQRDLRQRTADAEQARADLDAIRQAQTEIDDLTAEQERLRGQQDTEDPGRAERAEQLDSMQQESRRLAGELSRQARQQESIERLQEQLRALAAEAERDTRAAGEQLEAGSPQEVASDPRSRELGERSGERARETGQLKQSVTALRRESRGDSTEGAEERDAALAEAEQALARAADAARRAAAEQRPAPAA
ncbi:MAG: hypothetical protein ACO4BJ_05525, partial [Planctomycetota bacterium]